MYIRVSELKNLTIRAVDGDIGRCRDFLFDDEHWTVRYLELNTSRWLLGKRVLVSPAVAGVPDLEGKRLPVDITKAAIEGAPGLEQDQPVSRQYEAEFARHYGQMYYWWGVGLWGAGPYPGDILVHGDVPSPTPPREDEPEAEEVVNSIEEDNHLRSAQEVIGYTTHAIDGTLGDVDDFIVDTRTWTICFAVLDTGNWLPGRKVMLPVAWVSGISWGDRAFNIDVTRAALESAPSMEEPLSVESIKSFYAHFGEAGGAGHAPVRPQDAG